MPSLCEVPGSNPSIASGRDAQQDAQPSRGEKDCGLLTVRPRVWEGNGIAGTMAGANADNEARTGGNGASKRVQRLQLVPFAYTFIQYQHGQGTVSKP